MKPASGPASGLSGAGMNEADDVGCVAGAVGAGGDFSSIAAASPVARPNPTAAATAVATAHCERTGSSDVVGDDADGVSVLTPATAPRSCLDESPLIRPPTC